MKQLFTALTILSLLIFLNACKTVEIPVIQVDNFPSKVLEDKIETLTKLKKYPADAGTVGANYLVYTGPVGFPVSIDNLSFPDKIDATDAEAETEKIKHAFEFAYLVNQVPAFDRYWKTDGSLLWRQYKNYLNSIDMPDRDTSDQQKQHLKVSKTIKDTCNIRYNKYFNLYNDALVQYNQAIIQGISDAQKEQLKFELERKNEQWISEGCKTEYQAAIAFLEQFGRQDPSVMLNKVTGKLRSSLLESAQDGEFYYTTPFPYTIADSMWTTVELNGRQIIVPYLSGAGNKASYIKKVNLDSVKLSFDVLRVNIVRNWFEPSVVSKIKGIANSRFNFPYVTEIILIRNLEFVIRPYTKQRTKLVDEEGLVRDVLKKNKPLFSLKQQNNGIQIAAFICYFPSRKSDPNPDGQ